MLFGYLTGEAFGTFMLILTILIMTDDRTKLVDEEKPKPVVAVDEEAL